MQGMPLLAKCRILAGLLVCLILPACIVQPDGPSQEAALTVPTEAKLPPAGAMPPPSLVLDSKPAPASRPAVAALGRGQRITLEAAVTRALSWNPSIDEAIGRLNQSASEIEVARSGYYPKVTGGVNSKFDSNYRDGWRPQLNVNASQMVYDFGKVSSSVEIATSGKAVSHAQLLLSVDNLVRDTAYAVVEVQRNRALLKVAQDQVAGIEAIAKLVRQRSDGGASTRSDKVQAEARVQAAESTVLEVRAQLGRWEGTLASLLGGGGTVNLSTDVPAWLSKACNVIEPDWPQVPAMMRAEAQRTQAVAQLGRSKADIFPTLSLEAGVGYDLNRQSYSSITQSTPDRAQFSFGLNVSGSIYDGGATSARVGAANAALGAAGAARDNVRVETKRGLVEAQAQIGGLTALLKSLSFRDQMMHETRDLYRQQYLELGTRTLLDLLNAEQELHTAQFDGVRATHDLRRIWIDCLYNSGTMRKSFSLTGTAVRGVSL